MGLYDPIGTGLASYGQSISRASRRSLANRERMYWHEEGVRSREEQDKKLEARQNRQTIVREALDYARENARQRKIDLMNQRNALAREFLDAGNLVNTHPEWFDDSAEELSTKLHEQRRGILEGSISPDKANLGLVSVARKIGLQRQNEFNLAEAHRVAQDRALKVRETEADIGKKNADAAKIDEKNKSPFDDFKRKGFLVMVQKSDQDPIEWLDYDDAETRLKSLKERIKILGNGSEEGAKIAKQASRLYQQMSNPVKSRYDINLSGETGKSPVPFRRPGDPSYIPKKQPTASSEDKAQQKSNPSLTSVKNEIDSKIKKYSAMQSVDPVLISLIIKAESNYDPKAISPKGAGGLMQLMPDTAAKREVKDVFDIDQNIIGGIEEFKDLLEKYGDIHTALAAYNWGQGNVDEKGLGNMPKETRDYVNKITDQYSRAKGKENNPTRDKQKFLRIIPSFYGEEKSYKSLWAD